MNDILLPETEQPSELLLRHASPQRDVDTRETTIQPGDMVLLRHPNGDVRGVKIDKDSYGSRCALEEFVTDNVKGLSRLENWGHSMRTS